MFLLFASFVFGQETNSLVLKIRENQALMKNNMSEGFKELLVLEKIAQKEKNIKANLEVLNNKAFYYFTQADYDKAYQIAKSLEKESNNINDKRLIAIAINRLGITLNFLELYDDAEKKLFDAQKFILKNEFEDKNLILANNYQFLSDLYTHTENYKKAIYYIKKVILHVPGQYYCFIIALDEYVYFITSFKLAQKRFFAYFYSLYFNILVENL